MGNPTLAYKIQALELPADVDYSIEYMLVRHRRTDNSPLHNWLWQQVLEVRDEFTEKLASSALPGSR